MKVLFGFPGWGWKMYGLASFRSGSMWFIGFSKQQFCADETVDKSLRDMSEADFDAVHNA